MNINDILEKFDLPQRVQVELWGNFLMEVIFSNSYMKVIYSDGRNEKTLIVPLCYLEKENQGSKE